VQRPRIKQNTNPFPDWNQFFFFFWNQFFNITNDERRMGRTGHTANNSKLINKFKSNNNFGCRIYHLIINHKWVFQHGPHFQNIRKTNLCQQWILSMWSVCEKHRVSSFCLPTDYSPFIIYSHVCAICWLDLICVLYSKRSQFFFGTCNKFSVFLVVFFKYLILQCFIYSNIFKQKKDLILKYEKDLRFLS